MAVLRDHLEATLRSKIKDEDGAVSNYIAVYNDWTKITEAETSAGVTIVKYAYPPGHLLRYYSGSGSIHTAFQAANSQADNSGAPIFIPRGAWQTSAFLTVSADVDLIFENGASITYTGSSNGAVLTIGEIGSSTLEKRYERIRVLRQNQSDWSSESNVGVALVNIVRSSIQILESSNHTIGVQELGYDGGFYSNTIEFGKILNNAIAVDLTNNADATYGFCNSNYHYGGYFTVDTGINSTLNRYAFRINSASAVKYYNNANVFYNPTIELNTAGSGQAIPILVNYGTQNRWYDCRDEFNDTPFMICTNDSADNVAEQNYAVESTVQNNGTYKANFVRNLRRWAIDSFQSVWTSPPLHRVGNEYSASSDAYFAGMSVMQSSASGFLRAATGFSFSDNYVSYNSTRAIGILVDVRRLKRFVLRRECEGLNGGRVIAACLDASLVRLTSAGGGHPYATSTSGVSFPYTTDFGGVYQTGGDTGDDMFIAFGNDVQWAWIGISGGTNNAQVRTFGLTSIDGGSITAFQGFDDGSVEHYNDFQHYATAAPNNNIGITYPVGFRIIKADAAAGGSPGWICTTAGTGGTAVFKAEAAVAA